MSLNRNSTSVYLAAAAARGLSQAEAVQELLQCIVPQVDGVAGLYIRQVEWGGKEPVLYFEWWSPSAEVVVVFASEAAKQKAVIDITLRDIDLRLFDAPAIEMSVFNLKAWVTHRGSFEEEETAVPYAGVAAATRAGQYMHLHLSQLNQMLVKAVREEHGLAGDQPDQLEELLLKKLRLLLPDLPEGAVELIRVDSLRQTAKKRVNLRKARTLGGKGDRGWLIDEGIRIFTDLADGKLLMAVLEKGETEDGFPYTLFLSQPANTIKVEWRKPQGAKVWRGPRTPAKAVTEVDGFELEAESVGDLVSIFDAALEKYGRITLPAKGQKLLDQPTSQRDPWPTLRMVLPTELPEEVTWEAIIDAFQDTMGANQYDEVTGTGDDRIMESWACPPLPVPAAEVLAKAAAGRPAGAGGSAVKGSAGGGSAGTGGRAAGGGGSAGTGGRAAGGSVGSADPKKRPAPGNPDSSPSPAKQPPAARNLSLHAQISDEEAVEAMIDTSPPPKGREQQLKELHVKEREDQERGFAAESVKTSPKLMGALQAQHLKAKNDLLKKQKGQLEKLRKEAGDSSSKGGPKAV